MFSYHHHIGDFRRDTASLSDTDAMAYPKLLWMYYDTESPLPDDPEYLAFKIGASIEDVKQILKGFFTCSYSKFIFNRLPKNVTISGSSGYF